MEVPRTRLYRFAGAELIVGRRCVRRDDVEYPLRDKTFRVLLYLIEQRSRIVSRDELFERFWPQTAVTEDALGKCITEIRTALGDNAISPRYIRTFRKAGYRFFGPVEAVPPDDGRQGEQTVAAAPGARDSRTGETPPTHSPLPDITIPRRRAFLFVSLATLLPAVILALYLTFSSRHWGQIADLVFDVPDATPVLVTFFENGSAAADLDWLREGLADMLITDLSRSSRLALLSRQQLHLLLQRMGRDGEDGLDFEEAMELARRIHAEAIVSGSFTRFGDRIRLNVQLHDANTGKLRAAEGLTAETPDALLEQVELLALKLERHLGVEPTAGRPALVESMTPSLEAYRYYSLAVEKLQAYHTTEALELLEEAVRLDPEFAMAHARIGYAHAVIWNNQGQEALPHLEKAFRLARRLTDRDRLYIAAWYALARKEIPEAASAFRRIVQHYPRETEAYLRLGYLLRGQAKWAEAIELYRRALVVDPEAADIYNALGFLYTGQRALQAHRRYVELAPYDANSHDSLALSYISAGRYAEAAASLDRALSLQPDFHFARLHSADVWFALGRYRDAELQYRRYLELAPSDWDRAIGHHRLVLLYLRFGDLERAAIEAQAERELDNDFGGAFLVALAEGNTTEAARQLEGLETDSAYTEEESSPQEGDLNYFRGRLALARGNLQAGLDLLRTVAYTRSGTWNVEGIRDCLARALLGLQRWDELLAECRELTELNPGYPWGQYCLGTALERTGRPEEAVKTFGRFLEIWNQADPDLPEVVHARQVVAGAR